MKPPLVGILSILSGLLLTCGQPTEIKKPAAKAIDFPLSSIDDDVITLASHLRGGELDDDDQEVNELINHAIDQNWKVSFLEPGILYFLYEQGSGQIPKWGDYISVHYEGRSLQGKVFDSSRVRNRPLNTYVGNVVPGWNAILQSILSEGARGLFVIPAHLAYGEEGFGKMVKPNQHLIFDIQLLEILPKPGSSQ